MKLRFITGLCQILLLVQVAMSHPRQDTPYRPQKISRPVVLDGRLDEPVWQSLTPLPVTSCYPVFGADPGERTEIFLCYDKTALYIGGRFYDRQPWMIRGNSLRRDRSADSDDLFGLIIDSYNDNENALAFFTTPAGIRVDQTISNDAEPVGFKMPWNDSWNTFWDVATTRNDSGWFMEMRIPFSSLRFQDQQGRVVMGILAWRWIARNGENIAWPPIPIRFQFGHLKPSLGRDVEFSGIKNHRPVYLTPYVLGGAGYAFRLSPTGDRWVKNEMLTREAGLDIKYSLTSNLTLDVTANTDFAQVEADDEQVNLTRFSLFFPEKRLFFQERSSIFEFNTGAGSRLFYSRRIGIDGRGNMVRLYGGVRLVGRAGGWDIGALNMQTAASDYLPSENFGVLRLRRQVLNTYSWIGGMWTSRIAAGGTKNIAYGLDGMLRLFGDEYMTWTVAQSFDSNLSGQGNPLRNSRIQLRFERRRNLGWGYRAGVIRAGRNYNPGLGFFFRRAFTQGNGELFHTWLKPDSSFLQTVTLAMRGTAYVSTIDGRVETAEITPELRLSTKDVSLGAVNATIFRENLIAPFYLDANVLVPAGDYTFSSLQFFYGSSYSRLMRAELFLRAGSFYDGRIFSAVIKPSWNLSSRMALSGQYQTNRVSFPARNQYFRGDILQLRADLALNVRLSGSVFVQYNSVNRHVTVNLRLRYNHSEGNDLYLVYNDGINADQAAAVPALPFSSNRTFLLKYSFTQIF